MAGEVAACTEAVLLSAERLDPAMLGAGNMGGGHTMKCDDMRCRDGHCVGVPWFHRFSLWPRQVPVQPSRRLQLALGKRQPSGNQKSPIFRQMTPPSPLRCTTLSGNFRPNTPAPDDSLLSIRSISK